MYEYSWLIEKIRQNNVEEEIENAVDKALEEMPDDFGIKSFLIANREEVRMSILTEYDEQKTMNLLKLETLLDAIYSILEDLGPVPDDIKCRLESITDYEELKRLNKVASRSKNFEELELELPKKSSTEQTVTSKI